MTPPLEQAEQNLRKVSLAGRFFVWTLPVVMIAMFTDLSQWAARSRSPLTSVQPNLESVKQPFPSVKALGLSDAIFHPPEPEKPEEKNPDVIEVQWKLKGVLMGAGKRAILEDEKGQTLWVTEGDPLDSGRIKEIRDRSVILEKGGATVEIQM